MQQRSILALFDSGVGGLSIFRSVRTELPAISILYVCDNQHFPYGSKSEDSVISCVEKTIASLLKHPQFSIEALVIACNTASTIALPTARKLMKVPVIGVVPAIKPAATESQSKTIGLLATPGTVSRKYTEELILEYAKDCQVLKVGSTKLVELAEKKARGISISIDEVRKEIAPLFEAGNKKLDTVVLGCTHFPLLREELQLAAAWPVKWIDSGAAITNRIKSVVNLNSISGPVLHEALFTDLNASVGSLKQFLQNLGIESVGHL